MSVLFERLGYYQSRAPCRFRLSDLIRDIENDNLIDNDNLYEYKLIQIEKGRQF
jgi:hypothetical protein